MGINAKFFKFEVTQMGELLAEDTPKIDDSLDEQIKQAGGKSEFIEQLQNQFSSSPFDAMRDWIDIKNKMKTSDLEKMCGELIGDVPRTFNDADAGDYLDGLLVTKRILERFFPQEVDLLKDLTEHIWIHIERLKENGTWQFNDPPAKSDYVVFLSIHSNRDISPERWEEWLVKNDFVNEDGTVNRTRLTSDS